MLSLLSLIIASGTVLRADTELWEPYSYPDPRVNHTQCNTGEGSTLCDPDHILTDTWRQTIQDSITKQMAKLAEADIPYAEDSLAECKSNETEGVQIYVILAKRIQAASNQSITSNDLTTFGHGLREAFGLDLQPCKNYILILGVELAKEIYVWTGSDLAIPKEVMDNSLSQYKNLFIERNYMEGLNKIVDEIGDLIRDPYKDVTTVPAEQSTSETIVVTSMETSTALVAAGGGIPFWMYLIMSLCILITVAVVALLVFFVCRGRSINIQPYSFRDGKVPPHISDPEHISATSVPYSHPSDGEEDDKTKDSDSRTPPPFSHHKQFKAEDTRSMTSEVSLPRSESINRADRNPYANNDFVTVTSAPTKKIIRRRESSTSSSSTSSSAAEPESQLSKVCISPSNLSTDVVQARRNSETRPMPSPTINDHYSSF